MTTEKLPNDPAAVDHFLSYINASPTCYHAVDEAAKLLTGAGFEQLSENENWNLKEGGKYFFTRNQSALIAFAIGGKFVEKQGGFAIIGAHTDSPCPKLKPVTKLGKSGFECVSVQGYGGGLWHTWFDRDLGVAGRVIIMDKKTQKFSSKLVKIDRPILRIPNLAIHLQSDKERSGFSPNLQDNFPPILATDTMTAINSPLSSENIGEGNDKEAQNNSSEEGNIRKRMCKEREKHHNTLLVLIANELGCDIDDIYDFELQLIDTQPSCVSGAHGEFINSGRLDNLCSSYQGTMALINSCKTEGSLENDSAVRYLALFDHEEVGSQSAQGAGGTLFPESIDRILGNFRHPTGPCLKAMTLKKSFIVSADMAHALHPNYAGKHDSNHGPKFHGGVVVKVNPNQRYATNAATNLVFKLAAIKRLDLPVQEFAIRSDSRCGSTIGPMSATLTGIRTVDVGSPQLAMHSIREMMATSDLIYGLLHYQEFYELFSEIEASCPDVLHN